MSIGINITLQGMREIQQKLEKEVQAEIDALGAAIFQKGSAIMAESLVQCPVRESHLIKSHYVQPPSVRSGDPVVEIGYGKDYAIAVHEATGAKTWTKPGSGAKYLQRPVEKHQRGYADWVAQKQKENYASGVGMRGIGGQHPAAPKGA